MKTFKAWSDLTLGYNTNSEDDYSYKEVHHDEPNTDTDTDKDTGDGTIHTA